MYNTADGSSGNLTLAARGMCTILWTSATDVYVAGGAFS